MNPIGKVTCKILSNCQLHTFKGMIGYCLKDTGKDHFSHAMFNILDVDVIARKTLHAVYDKSDLKSRVTLTNKNALERILVWYKFQERHQMRATFLSTLTDMVKSGLFILATSWIIPMNGQGMDYRRMGCLFKCLIDPASVSRDDIQEIFIKKRNYVKGRYFDSEDAHEEKAKVLKGDDARERVDLPPGVPKEGNLLTPIHGVGSFADASLFCLPTNPLCSTSTKLGCCKQLF